MSGENELTTEQRDKIILLIRKQYELLGCNFPQEDTEELIYYLYDSMHGDEIRCVINAIEAHNIYNNDKLTVNDFYEWHGM